MVIGDIFTLLCDR